MDQIVVGGALEVDGPDIGLDPVDPVGGLGAGERERLRVFSPVPVPALVVQPVPAVILQ